MRALHCLGRHKPVDVDGLVRSWSSIVPAAPAVPVCLGATAGEGSHGEGKRRSHRGEIFPMCKWACCMRYSGGGAWLTKRLGSPSLAPNRPARHIDAHPQHHCRRARDALHCHYHALARSRTRHFSRSLPARPHRLRIRPPLTRRRKQHNTARRAASPRPALRPRPCFSPRISCSSLASWRASGWPPTSTRSSPRPRSCRTRSTRTFRSSSGPRALLAAPLPCA